MPPQRGEVVDRPETLRLALVDSEIEVEDPLAARPDQRIADVGHKDMRKD